MKEWRNKYCYSWQKLQSIVLLRLLLQDGFYIRLEFGFSVIVVDFFFHSFIHFDSNEGFVIEKYHMKDCVTFTVIVYAACEWNEQSRWKKKTFPIVRQPSGSTIVICHAHVLIPRSHSDTFSTTNIRTWMLIVNSAAHMTTSVASAYFHRTFSYFLKQQQQKRGKTRKGRKMCKE